MFYKYPYTNLYNLNLDWLIQAVKELQEIVEPLENVVTSVNGMTGNVELTREILTRILGGMVSKFNGRDGDVELTAEDVNSTLIDITWTSDPGDVIGDLTQTELDALYTSGKRVLIFVNNLGVADQVYFLQYYDNHAMPQEYSPTSALAGVATFNGQTGNVTATGADLATSGTDTTPISESIAELEESKVPVTRTVNNQPLSANISINAANVPSQAIAGATDVEMALGNLNNSKVPNLRRVNGKSLLNDITLNDEDIPSQVVSGQTTVEGALTDIDSRVNSQSQQIDEKADIPVTVTVTVDANGATMSAADQAKLTADMVMCWYSGDRSKLTSNLSITPATGSATVTGTASSSTTFTIAFIHSANVEGVASVIDLKGTLHIQISVLDGIGSGHIDVYKNGKTVYITGNYSNTAVLNIHTPVFVIPVDYRPIGEYYFVDFKGHRHEIYINNGKILTEQEIPNDGYKYISLTYLTA